MCPELVGRIREPERLGMRAGPLFKTGRFPAHTVYGFESYVTANVTPSSLNLKIYNKFIQLR